MDSCCNAPRMLNVEGEIHSYDLENTNKIGVYIQEECNIGKRQYLGMTFCLGCGKIRGKWPVPNNLPLFEDDENDSEETSSSDSDNTDILSNKKEQKYLSVVPFDMTNKIYRDLVYE